jgi:hypothetical protein
MTRFDWWLLSLLARALEAPDRDVVLGDLAESGAGLAPAMLDLLGLIARRQFGLWLSWRPWLALFGVCGLAGLSLSRIVFRLNVDLYKRYAAHYGTALTDRQEVAFFLCMTGALLVWSWTCGFALGSLSGRTVWLTWSVFYFVVLDSAWAQFVVAGNIILRHSPNGAPLDALQGTLRLLMAATLPLTIAALLFLFPALLGAFVGVRWRTLDLGLTYLFGAANAAFAFLATWATGWYDPAHLPAGWPGVPWAVRLLPFLLVSWPAAYLLACGTPPSSRPTDETALRHQPES